METSIPKQLDVDLTSMSMLFSPINWD